MRNCTRCGAEFMGGTEYCPACVDLFVEPPKAGEDYDAPDPIPGDGRLTPSEVLDLDDDDEPLICFQCKDSIPCDCRLEYDTDDDGDAIKEEP